MATFRDDLARSVEIETPVRRIVSLVPNLSELIVTLGQHTQLIAVTDFCVEPPNAFDHAVRVRGTKNPDLAAIMRLDPGVVFTNDEENRQLDVERLEAAGVPVYVTRVRTISDVPTAVQGVANVLGCAEAGSNLMRELATLKLTAPARRPRVCCPIWRDGAHRGDAEQWWCVGPDTYAGQLLHTAGFDLVVSGNDLRYPQQSLSDIRAQEPDVVLLPDEPYRFTADDATVFTTWPQTRVMPYRGTDLFWWGPRTAGALKALAAVAASLPGEP